MSPESIPQISLGTAALVIFAVCAAFVVLRGMTRVLVGTIVLAVSAWIAFRVWQAAPAWSLDWFGRSVTAFTTGLPVAAFLVSWFLIRKLVSTLVRPFGKKEEPEEPKRSSPVARAALGLALALVPASLLWLVGATFIHHSGAVAEIHAFAEKSLGIGGATPAKFSERLKTAIEGALPESWLAVLDPMADPSRLTLAKIVTARADSPLEPVIDPKTGEPIPRAIIVDDPELQQLARDGKYGTLLRHPLLTKTLEDPRVRSLLKDLHL
ncbi:MAG: hypothetical protein H7A50_01410 [Akkermansiaceae bacterium]|nr:hypothetical protein [Akkermansiaceae bacterium]